MFKTTDKFEIAAMFGMAGLALGVMLGKTVNPTKTFDKSKVIVVRSYDEATGNVVYRMFYEDADYDYEVSDVNFDEAMRSLKNMVLA